MEPLKKPGKLLVWLSNGREKRGRVRGVVPAGESALAALERLGVADPKARLQSRQDVAQGDRYLVEVPRRGSELVDYYVPLVRVIRNAAMRRAQRAA